MFNDNVDIKEVIKKDRRYKHFTILERPGIFKDIYKDDDISVVQIHSTQTLDVADGKELLGFVGSFTWNDNQIIPLDGDSYDKNALVLGYDRWKDEEGTEIVDILVGENW